MKKYEREIREILEKMDSFVNESPSQERDRELKRKPTNIGVMSQTTPRPIFPKMRASDRLKKWMREHSITGNLSYMLLGFIFMISGLMVLDLLGGAVFTFLAQVLVLIGFGLYVAPVFIRFFGGGKRPFNGSQIWRGEIVQDEPVFTWKKLKGWITGSRKGKGKPPWDGKNRNRW